MEGEREGLLGLAAGEARAEEDLDLPLVRDLKVLRREE